MGSTALHPLRCFRTCFPSLIFSRRELRISLISSSSSSKLRIHPVWLNSRGALLQDRPRASSEGAPIKLVEDPKFVPLNVDDPVFGPPALFLMGFDSAEINKMRKFLKELDGEFLKAWKMLMASMPLSKSYFYSLFWESESLDNY